jgi:hypothetical protein
MAEITPKNTHDIQPKKPSSLEEGSSGSQSQMSIDSESVNVSENNGIRKSTLTKREIMEQLSRERFPWEE